MNSSFKIGHRTLKTVAAVFICLLVNFLFGKKEPFYAVIAAILCIQPSIHKSMDIGVYRIIGTVFGSVFCFFVLWAGKMIPYYSDFMYLLVIPIMTLAFIYLLNIFRLKNSVPVATITFIVMIFTQKPEINGTLAYAIERTLDTIVGAVIGVLVNRYMFRNDWRYTTDKLDEIDNPDYIEADDNLEIEEAEKLTKSAETDGQTETADRPEIDRFPEIKDDGLLESGEIEQLPPTISGEELQTAAETSKPSDAEENIEKDVLSDN